MLARRLASVDADASIAATVFFQTDSSVSPKYWRRSLWPTMTHFTPTAASMGPDTSPVYAPSFFQNRFWAPMPMRVPSVAATAAGRFGKVGQRTTSRPSAAATSGRNLSKNAWVSWTVLYIFQLPAINGVLIRSLLEN